MYKAKFKQNILAGLAAIIPVALTLVIVHWLFKFFASPMAPLVGKWVKDERIPSFIPELIGFLMTIIIIYFLGVAVRNILGRRLWSLLEEFIHRIPIVNSIYKTFSQIASTISAPQAQAFQKVVFIEYPRKGLWTVAMVTGSSLSANGELFYHLFVPTTPNPTSGFMIIIAQQDAIETRLSVEDGLRMVISGGVVAPEKTEIQYNPKPAEHIDEQ